MNLISLFFFDIAYKGIFLQIKFHKVLFINLITQCFLLKIDLHTK